MRNNIGKRMLSAILLILLGVSISGCADSKTTDDGRANAARADASCRAIEILVGFGVGGGTDLFARNMATGLRRVIGLPVQVVNITGGSGVGAFRELVKRRADGCTLLALTTDYVVLSVLQPEDVDLNRLRPVLRAHTELGLLSTRRDGEVNWAALRENAREEDRKLLIGGVGARSFDRAAVDITLGEAGLPYRYIPYGGAKEMQADLLGGRLDAIYDEFGVMKPMLDAGEARALVVFNEYPVDLLPDTPPARALDLNVAPPIWRGLAIHAETPDTDISRLIDAAQKAMATPHYREYEMLRHLDLMDGALDGPAFASALAGERAAFSNAFDSQRAGRNSGQSSD